MCWRAQAQHVLVSTDGPYDNVIKMKPPLVFDERDVDELVAALRCATHRAWGAGKSKVLQSVPVDRACCSLHAWARLCAARAQLPHVT